MFRLKFSYSHNLVNLLCAIERTKTILESRKIEERRSNELEIKSLSQFVADSLIIEKTDISYENVYKLLTNGENGLESDQVTEAQNLIRACNYLDEILKKDDLSIALNQILEVNRLCYRGVRNKENHTGKIREIQTWTLNNNCSEIAFTPPSPEKAPGLVNEVLHWIESESVAELHPIIKSGIFYGCIVYINPFVYGSLKTALLLLKHSLERAGYDFRGWGQLAGYFKMDLDWHHRKLAKAFSGKSEEAEAALCGWLEYFSEGVLFIYNQVDKEARRVEEGEDEIMGKYEEETPGIFVDKLRGEIDLNERQRLILELGLRYQTFHRRDIRSDLEITGRYSPKTISRDLKALVDLGYLQKGGERKGVYYTLAKSPH